MVNGTTILYYHFGGIFMTPILSLHNIDVVKFLAVLDTCEGNVFLVTNEGDRLNL